MKTIAEIPAFFARHRNILVTIVMALVFLYLAYGFLLTLRYWVNIAKYPGEIDYSEPVMVYESGLLPKKIYAGPDADYFTAANHGPLYYVISAAAFSLKPNTYLPGRILSLFGVLLVTLSFLFLTYRETKRPLALFFACMMSVFPTSVIAFGPVIKPDSLYIGLTFAALAVALTCWNSRLLYLSAPLFVLALFIKPSALPAPIAVVAVLMLRDWKSGVLYSVICAGLSALLLGLFLAIFGWQLFVHLFLYNAAQYNAFAGLVSNPAGYVYFFYPLIILAIISMLGFGRRNVLIVYFFAGIVIHVMLIGGKAGSTINYWSEPTLALALMISLGFANFLENRGTPRYRTLFVAGLALVAALSRPAHGKNVPKPEAYRNHDNIRAAVAELAGPGRPPAHASSPGTAALDSNLVHLPIADTFLYNQHVLLGRNDGHLMENYIRQKKFRFVTITSKTRDFSDLVLQERMLKRHRELVFEHYRLDRVLPGTPYTEGDVYFYVPK